MVRWRSILNCGWYRTPSLMNGQYPCSAYCPAELPLLQRFTHIIRIWGQVGTFADQLTQSSRPNLFSLNRTLVFCIWTTDPGLIFRKRRTEWSWPHVSKSTPNPTQYGQHILNAREVTGLRCHLDKLVNDLEFGFELWFKPQPRVRPSHQTPNFYSPLLQYLCHGAAVAPMSCLVVW